MAPFTGLSPRCLAKLVTVVRRKIADEPRRGRPWGLPLENRVLLVAAYWRTNLTLRRLAPLFGVAKSAADRIIDDPGPKLALQPRKRFAKGTVLIVDGTLVPTRDHSVAERSKNHRCSTNHQVVIDADTRLVVVVGNRSHNQVRARVEHTFARMKGWKILRDCRLKGDGVHHAKLGIARLHNLALTG
ncbi:transposase family protein [Streptomyces europaeiscabiei]|uniref:Transposase family protein n=1 Tax=Streptomyces europaeiscabiei TaxID=146819 RepID=A0AAJ2PXM7_9ACTN|nr:transposase family protein [Streptomyces europaeiscabiei]MDX3135143.1 transposase family protein [Streptomyces europaeiscabiei]